ncbi:MlaE family ABC transporter permease [Desulfurispira natronophila]|uniref:Phospholipid/cholesterol/gamma-HCH transport system permease protein n=1 Tax=Desulfurispira natronophila TaxID=682562 RepID=A0A7W7Y289_9BACT|nr:ABC transporter permease [Desulfurispira natronophila]MBB5020750.1 phospholipid/cholesterol/gamma-HCH transport system permease protein [Desulfurispira natronophila]
MSRLLNSLGMGMYCAMQTAGLIFFTFLHSATWLFRPPFRARAILKQLEFVGVNSLFVVVLTGAFTGMVMALQLYIGFRQFHAEYLVGAVAALAITRELGPVLTALMVTARAGSAMAAELGTMKVTEQIDALRTMAVDPHQYLAMPRILASFLMLPILTMVANAIAIGGSYLVGVQMLGINPVVFVDQIVLFVDMSDVLTGLVKSAAFGLVMGSVCCGIGMNASKGAAGVGRVTTTSVVLSSTLILAVDYVLTALMF